MARKYGNGGKIKATIKEETYNQNRANQLGYTPDSTGHLPSVDYQTGEWLKSTNHPTAWKEYLYGYVLNPEVSSKYNLGFDPGGYFGSKQLKYYPKKYGNGGKVEPTSKGYQQSASKYQPLYGKDFGEDEVIAAMIKDGYDKNTAIKYARLMQNNGPLSGKVFNIPSSFYNSDESSQMYPGSYYAPKRVEDVPYTPPSLGAKRVGKDLRPFSDNPYMEAPVEIFQNGGRVAPRTPSAREREVTPIYVTDPNDPRLKAYNDSLFLYNKNDELLRGMAKKEYKLVQQEKANLNSRLRLLEKVADGELAPNTVTKPMNLKNEGNGFYSLDDYASGIIDKTLPRQYFKSGIMPAGFNVFSENLLGLGLGDKRVAFDYSNVKPKQKVIYKPGTTEAQAFNNSETVNITPNGDFRFQPGGVFYDAPIIPKPSHPTTPYMNKMPMRGMPNTNVSAEPMSVLPRTTNGLPFPDSWITNSSGTGEVMDYIPEHLRLDPAKQGWRSKQRGTAPAKATINKYDFGGLIDYNDTGLRRANTLASIASTQSKQRSNYKNGLFNYIKDAGLYLADNTLNTVGLGNVINSDTYNTKFGSKTLNNASSISGEISKVVAPIALSAVGGPLAGSAYSAGRSFIEGNINPDQYKNGGQVMKEIINIEGGGKQKGSLSEMKGRGELNVDLLGNILQNYTSYNPHPTNGRDVSSDVAVDGNTAIIPKKKAADFLSSNKRERQREILSLISKQKARERKKGIPMAAGGWVTADNSNWSTMDTSTGKMSTPGGGTDWGALATKYGPQALSLLSPLTKVGRGLFDKVENINSSDYMVSPNLKPSLISDTASQMMINDSTNAGLNSLRRMNAGPSATVNLAVNSMKQKWASRQEIQRANATSTMTTDQANKQIAANNAGMGLKIRDMNDMNKAAKRNMLMEGINDLSKQGNKMIYDESFFQTLPMMADNPQFNRWLEKNGYRKG